MATITVRIEEWTKSKFYDIADELWISVSSMINGFVKDTIRKRGVSFSINDEYAEDQEMYTNQDMLKIKGQQSLQSGRSSLII